MQSSVFFFFSFQFITTYCTLHNAATYKQKSKSGLDLYEGLAHELLLMLTIRFSAVLNASIRS